ncbi:MAG: tape measure protein [Gammaproteobacteria bacterium]|nr:tape measure protein [Gammaproteobacteria bacterium]
MAETSTLNIEINLEKALVDLRKLNRGLDKTEKEGNQAAKSVKRTGTEAEKASRGFGFLKTAVASVFTISALSGFTRVIATFQALENSLGVVFQSAERGREVFKDIQDLAATTPFSVEALTESVIKLRAAGIEPTTEQLTLFSDVSSVTADTLGSLQAITDLFARTTAGGLGLEDLNRLADRGIPVFTILQEKLGLARLEVSELGKTAEGARQLLGALTEGLEERFGGASAQAANLLKTQISNLGDAWDRFLVSLGESGGISLLSAALTGITSALEFMSENLDTVAVALSGLATLAIPAVIKAVKALTLAIAANPIGLIVVAISAAVAAMYHFRGVIFDTLVKAWEVWVPNAIDATLLAFTKIDRAILDVVNSILGGISRLANTLINQTPEWLKGWLGIDGASIDLKISTKSFDDQITFLENRIADRIKNFKPPPRPDFLGIDEGETDTGGGGGGLQSGALTGNRIALAQDDAAEQAFTKEQARVLQKLDFVEQSLMTEEERLFDSYARRQFIVEDAYENELISEARRQELLLGLTQQYETQRLGIEKKGWTERQKFAALSAKAQTQTVLAELLNMTAGVAQENRTLFEINKAAGIANAIINTYEGVSETKSKYPWPLAGVMAAAHLVSGLATVNAIRNTPFEGGGGGSIPSAAGGGAPAPAADIIQPIEAEPREEGRQIIINVVGDFTTDGFRLAVVDAVETAEANDEVRIVNAN